MSARLHLPRLAEPAPAPAARPDRRAPRAAARRRRRGRRGARGRARRRAAGRLRRARHARQARARRVARLRARGLPPAPILCADTTVALGRRILGKPRDAADAARMLALLSGRTHRVHDRGGGAAAARTRGSRVSVSRVRFAAIDAGADRRATSPAASRSARPAPMRSRARRRPGSSASAAATPVSWVCRCTRRPRCSRGRASLSGPRRHRDRNAHDARHPDQLVAAGNARRRRRERRGAGAARRAHARARPGRQHLPRQGRARAARHAVGLHRHRPGARRLPARGRRLTATAARSRGDHAPGRGAAAADRAAGVRGPVAHGAGDQGPDRHQGRAAVDADQHRRPAAGLPAAGRPHRHLAEDRLARAARAAARAHEALLAQAAATARGGDERRRLHPAHQRRGGERRRAGRRHRLPAQDLGARSASARFASPPGIAAAPGPEPGRARAARPGQRATRRRSASTRAMQFDALREFGREFTPSAVGKLAALQGRAADLRPLQHRRGDRARRWRGAST